MTALLKIPNSATFDVKNPETWDVRPIAVGETLRRLASKCMCSLVKSAALRLMGRHQFGVAHPGGLEFVVHRAREVVLNNCHSPDFVVFKVDFENAFNVVSREAMLDEVDQHLPDLLPWIRWCYSSQPLLNFSLGAIRSLGVQQGDVWSSIVFGGFK